MKITTVGKGTIPGTLARRATRRPRRRRPHRRARVRSTRARRRSRAVPSSVVADTLADVTGLRDKVIIDATNRLGGEATPTGYPSGSALSEPGKLADFVG